MKNSGTQVTLTTNGTLFTESKILALLETNINSIDISIDANSEATYSQIRRKGNFEILQSNVKNLIRLRNQAKFG